MLRPRTGDLAGSWASHAHRCLHKLPGGLAWAAPLLDPAQPTAVLCAREQVRALIAWHHHLPTYEQVSFTSQRLGRRSHPAQRGSH